MEHKLVSVFGKNEFDKELKENLSNNWFVNGNLCVNYHENSKEFLYSVLLSRIIK